MTSEERDALIRRRFAEIHARFRALDLINREDVQPAITQGLKATQLDETIFLLHMRALGWGFSISRLDDIFDFQAQSAGCRSLCEIVIDLALLTSGAEHVGKMVDWEEHMKLRLAKKRAAAESGNASVREAAIAFVKSRATAIAAACARQWPNNSRPQRWTGQSLGDDAIRVDGLVKHLRLTEFMREEYERLCSATHGSNLTSVRNISEDLFPGLATLAVYEGARLLEHEMQLVLEHFKLFDEGWRGRMQSTHARARLEVALPRRDT